MPGLYVAFFAAVCAAQTSAPIVLTRAYSHNDYQQDRPLLDALDRGFFGVEADVHLRGRELLVGHEGGDTRPGVTLQKLYLDPLLARVRANGGRVHAGGPAGFVLMVEFKSDGDESYPVLREILKGYKEMLSAYTPDRFEEKAVTVVITGNRPNDLLKAEPLRYAGIDGDLGDLHEPDKTLFPVISGPWWRLVESDGRVERVIIERLRKLSEAARSRGRKLRFYDVPNRTWAWDLLFKGGVDLINADDLQGLRDFLLAKQPLKRIAPLLSDPFVKAR